MERIVKIGKNHIEVQTVLFDQAVRGKEVIVSIETYGQNRIDEEKQQAEAQKVYWDGVVKTDERQKEQDKLTKLGLIQSTMDAKE